MAAIEREFEYCWFTELGNNEKGELGEKLVGLYLKPQLREAFDVSRIRVNYDVTFHANPVNKEGTHNHYRWRADLVFKNYQIEQKIIVEVKTGEYAELERRQRTVMEWLSRNPNHRILRSGVDLREESFSLQFAEFIPESDALWKPVDFLEST
jgi:hypothetical protein